MNGSPEFLEYYLVEAAEYLDALDQLIAVPEDRVPDTNALLATARALRGSSAMAKADPIASIAREVESLVGRIADGSTPWEAGTAALLRRTVVDLRLLVRGVRVWGAREEALAEARLAELRRVAPTAATTTPRPTPTHEATVPVFIALQSAAIAAELTAFVNDSTNRRALDDAVGRSRTLRGVAGIGAFPPLADAAESVERIARRILPDAPLTAGEVQAFRTGAALFRVTADRLRTTATYSAAQQEAEQFASALAALDQPTSSTPPVVRIDQLFHPDPGPHVVSRAAAPPVTAEQRLHNDLMTRAEHLQRLVGEGREVSDPVSAARVRRDLNSTTRDLETLAASYGAHELSAFFAESREARDVLGAVELDALDAASRIIARPFDSMDDLERSIATVQRRRHLTPASVPSIPNAGPRPSRATPTGADLKALLGTGIAGFSSLDTTPLSEPADLDATDIVPIESLLFRGPAAIDRAIALRDTWRARGMPPDETLQEIFDLLDLARPDAS
ncbi:MAG: Hpt domain-containing protein [Gemmatimonadetes bacterium]|nr:Hpt domain-containing protein [Gemmatimonadota bacterium]